MHIRTRSINPALAILELNGRLTAESGSALCDAALAVLAEGGRHLILNLSGVRALDASGLGGLAATLRLVREVGGELKVVAGSAAIDELLRRTHLSVALPAVASEAEAIASFETAKV